MVSHPRIRLLIRKVINKFFYKKIMNRMYLNVREIFVSKGVVRDPRALQMGPRAKPEDQL